MSMPSGLSDDEVLHFTQSIRHQFVSKVMTDNIEHGGFPVDKGESALLLQTLTDMDRTAISKKKLVIEQGQSENDRVAAQLIAQLAMNPAFTAGAVMGNGRMRDITPDLDLLPEITQVPGQTSIGVEVITYDEFVQTIPNRKASVKANSGPEPETEKM